MAWHDISRPVYLSVWLWNAPPLAIVAITIQFPVGSCLIPPPSQFAFVCRNPAQCPYPNFTTTQTYPFSCVVCVFFYVRESGCDMSHVAGAWSASSSAAWRRRRGWRRASCRSSRCAWRNSAQNSPLRRSRGCWAPTPEPFTSRWVGFRQRFSFDMFMPVMLVMLITRRDWENLSFGCSTEPPSILVSNTFNLAYTDTCN